mgnify:CR=1 FL=1
MSSKQMVNVSEGFCFRLANVVPLQRQSEQTGLQNLFGLTMTELYY